MKKILGLAIAALVVIAMVAAGTYAYFQDTETSTNNNITAGTLDLKLNGADSNVNIVAALTDKKPGDADMAPGPHATLLAAGTLTGKLSIAFGTVTDTESTGPGEFLADGIGGAGVGELGGKVQIAPWIDVNHNGTFDTGDIPLSTTGAKTFSDGLQWATVDAFSGVSFTNVIASFASAATVDFYLPWNFVNPGSLDNSAQGDSFNVGITFTLDQ
jgi:predicted ribosomally synthesized peptide with SipW-like signal peptide